MAKIIVIWFVFGICNLSLSYAGDDESLYKARWYKAYWGNIYIGDLFAEIAGKQIRVAIQSYGLVATISRYRSVTLGQFRMLPNGYIPEYFATQYRNRQGERRIALQYDSDGNLVKETVIPPDKRWKRPAVSEALKQHSVDPVTAFMVARWQLKKALEEGHTNIAFTMYDGRRLSRFDFTLLGRKDLTMGKHTYPVVIVRFLRHPVAGYTNNELQRMKGEEPEMVVYVTEDALFLPVRIDAKAPLGQVVIRHAEDCHSLEHCQEKSGVAPSDFPRFEHLFSF